MAYQEIVQVKLPAEPEDFLKRPAYISTNAVGMPICENRLVAFLSRVCMCVNSLLGFNISLRRMRSCAKGELHRLSVLGESLSVCPDR